MRRVKNTVGNLITVLVFLFSLGIFALYVYGAGPGTITYQGKVTTRGGGTPKDGYYKMRFSLWNTGSGGTPEANLKWQETYTDARPIYIQKGTFVVRLSGVTPFPDDLFHKNRYLWLEVQVDLDNDGFEEEEIYSPRIQLTATPYAFQCDRSTTASIAIKAQYAINADTLNGKHASDFARADHIHYLPTLPGILTDEQIPNDITIDRAKNAYWCDWSTSASYAIGAYYSSVATTLEGKHASDFALANHTHNLQDLSGAVTDAQVPDTVTISYAATAGNADKVDGKHASDFALAGHTHYLQSLLGAVTDAQVPDNITINHALTAGNADTVDGKHAADFAAAAHTHNLQDLSGAVTDAQVPNNITVDYATSAGNADTLDGHHGTFYQNADNINAGTLAEPRIDSAIARVGQISPKQFEAVVAPSGGDYTSVKAALTAGKKTIFVRNGTHTISSDIGITQSGTVIIGESRNGVIIDCNNTTYGIRAYGDTANYTAGTVSITFGSATVTGASTNWSGNVSDGEYIMLKGEWYQIATVDSDTQLTLTRRYQGRALTNVSYKIAAMLSNLRLENLTLMNFCQDNRGVIEFHWVIDSLIQNCRVKGNQNCGLLPHQNYGIYLREAYNCKLHKNFCPDNIIAGIFLSHSDNNSLMANTCHNNLDGISLDSSSNNTLAGNSCNNNQIGIFLDSSAHNNLSGNSCCYNADGIKFTNSSSNNTLAISTCNGNINGIYIFSSSDYNTLSANSCNNNINGIYISSSSNNTLGANSCNDNSHGIYLYSSSKNALSSNNARSNSDVGVYLNTECDENTFIGNSFTDNTNYGIHIYNAGCDHNIVGMNILTGNPGGPGKDGGTNTLQKYTNYPTGW